MTSAYKDMMKQFLNFPFASDEALGLNTYMTEKAVSGLFVMLAEEEKISGQNLNLRQGLPIF